MRKIKLEQTNLSSSPTPQFGEFIIGYNGLTFSQKDSNGIINPIGGFKRIVVTKSELDLLVLSNGLSIGSQYYITGVNTGLYGGTDILVTAVSTNKISKKGIGKFFNPKYNNTIDGYGIWSSTGTYVINDTVIWGGKKWQNNGTVAMIALSIDSFTLNTSWDVIPYNEIDYNVVFDEIEYNYDNDFMVSRRDAINDIYVVMTYQMFVDWGTDYNYSPIKLMQWGNGFDDNLYKGMNGIVIQNAVCNLINFRGSYVTSIRCYEWSYFNNNTFEGGSGVDSIVMYNGGSIVNNTLTNNSYIYGNSLSNSHIDANTLTNSNITNNTLTNSLGISGNILTNNSYIVNNTITDNGYINVNILTNNSYIYSNSLSTNSSIYYNTLSNSIFSSISTISSKILSNNSFIGVNTIGMSFGTSSIIFETYAKNIFSNSAGLPRLSYYNTSDVLTIVNVNA